MTIVRDIVQGESGGTDTSSGDATASDILDGKIAWVDGVEVTGTYTLAAATATGDASAWHIKTGKKAWVDGSEVTGTAYTPAIMQYNGASGFYSHAFTSSGNKVTTVARVQAPPDLGASLASIVSIRGDSSILRTSIRFFGSTYATAALRNKIWFAVTDASSATKCQLVSSLDVTWSTGIYTIFAAFDGDVGAAMFYINGSNADDAGNSSRVAPSAATLDAGVGSFNAGSSTFAGAEFSALGIGFLGHRQAYLTNWSDFMQTDGFPKSLDVTTWTEWSGGSVTSPNGRPSFWNPHGDMVNNLGSAGAMTKNGTINVGNGGNT